MTNYAVALTIAGSDSGGGAGIQADLKTFASLGVYGASVITAVTAQDTERVYDYVALEPSFVAEQIDVVMGDIGAHVVKTGMLANAAIIVEVAQRLSRWDVINLVVDPVMVAKGGDKLLRDDAITMLKDVLLPQALVVTPNLPEAEALVGGRLDTWDAILEAAREIHSWGPRNVVIKGGHVQGTTVTDVLFDGEGFREFTTGRVDTENTHGTGCTFASAIAATLAKGDTVPNAVAAAKAFVTKALQESYTIGHGHGPVHHFYRYWRPVPREETPHVQR
jgi:hydroxymethylpyrimidine/phosphomethylpyrimidine kinase